MATVGIRELKNNLSAYLRRVGRGERVTVTDRGKPIAVIAPPVERGEDDAIAGMVREGLARWAGGKPEGPARPTKIRGKPISQTVIEGRR